MELDILNKLKKDILYRADAVNFTTGQKKLIEEYKKARRALVIAIENESNPERKKAMRAEYEKITEETVTKTHDEDSKLVGLEIENFNPNKTFQKKKSNSKVADKKRK